MTARDARLFHPDFSTEPYWWQAWRPSPGRGARDVPARIDVALIGGGLTSLNAALELARAGVSCVVLEAREFGSGASTRNGGGVSGGINIGKGLGGRKGETDEALRQAMIADAAQALDHLESLIAREGIDCDYERSGRFAGAFTPAHHRAQARQCELLNAHARAEARLLPRARVREEMASDFYYGGMIVERSGKLHPAKFYGGLLDAAARAGAVLVADAPVTHVARDGGGWRLTTPRGTLLAEKVFVGTNGYTGAVTPTLRRRTIPVASHMIATEELDPALAASLIPKGRFLSETKRVLCYYRLSPDGRRVLFGGLRAGGLHSGGVGAVGGHPRGGGRGERFQAGFTEQWRGHRYPAGGGSGCRKDHRHLQPARESPTVGGGQHSTESVEHLQQSVAEPLRLQ
jgi:glycine/D-amino acid oxidase-like deaminating enzyme